MVKRFLLFFGVFLICIQGMVLAADADVVFQESFEGVWANYYDHAQAAQKNNGGFKNWATFLCL